LRVYNQQVQQIALLVNTVVMEMMLVDVQIAQLVNGQAQKVQMVQVMQYVPLVQHDMVATALRALLAKPVSLTRTARLRLTLVHVSHATRRLQLLAAWRATAATTALQEAAMPDTMARPRLMALVVLGVLLVELVSTRMHQVITSMVLSA
jgi:hypothetical protein